MRSIMQHTGTNGSVLKLRTGQFRTVQKMVHDYCGIFMQESKIALVQSRLMKRVRVLGLSGFEEYLNYLTSDKSGEEFLSMIDVLTTNKTSFFREAQHFDYINQNIIPEMKGREVKWWSAGCSSGQEPVTCAINLLEGRAASKWESVKILATDLARDMISEAKQAVYPLAKMQDVPPAILEKYFIPVDLQHVQVSPEVLDMITYGRLNLMESWPLRGPFQLIMCRNVMIYFNRQTQKEIVNKFFRLLEPGGYLFLGHSESISPENKGFINVAPAVYQKGK